MNLNLTQLYLGSECGNQHAHGGLSELLSQDLPTEGSIINQAAPSTDFTSAACKAVQLCDCDFMSLILSISSVNCRIKQST